MNLRKKERKKEYNLNEEGDLGAPLFGRKEFLPRTFPRMGIKGKRCQLKWSKVISLFAIIVRLVFIKRYSEIIMSIFCSQRKITWNFIKNQKDSLNLLFIEKKTQL